MNIDHSLSQAKADEGCDADVAIVSRSDILPT